MSRADVEYMIHAAHIEVEIALILCIRLSISAHLAVSGDSLERQVGLYYFLQAVEGGCFSHGKEECVLIPMERLPFALSLGGDVLALVFRP